jgi:hypothetical protein
MPDKNDRKIVIAHSGGVFQELSLRIKLIIRLLGDKRVNLLYKMLPIGSLVYLVIPDIAPGPIDDAALIWLATHLFVELCPPDVVHEHLDALQATRIVMDGYQETSQTKEQEVIIDGEIVDEYVEVK